MTTYATLHTNHGDIKIELFPNHAPKAVTNFVGLADGSQEWTDPRTGATSNAPLYDGVVFHRVISGFMIQGGDPLGTGTGGPGYRFNDEFHGDLVFDKPYLLAMANAGPNTNGSQFFIVTTDAVTARTAPSRRIVVVSSATMSTAWPKVGQPPVPGAFQNLWSCDFEIAQYVR